MISAINSALSGLSASVKRLETSAHNTANLSTEGFKKETVLQSEGMAGGVVVHIQKSETPGPGLPKPDGSFSEGSNVDMAEEAVNQIVAAFELGANMATLKAADEAAQSVIDLFA